MEQFDVVVVGNGLFGSAAARHLVALGESVLVIGPDEPRDHTSHEGVFASHYDEGRLIRLADARPLWVPVTRRAIENYRQLAAESGIEFHHPVGALIVLPAVDVEEETAASPLPLMRRNEVAHTVYSPGDRAWQVEFPQLSFPADYYVIHETAPAGHINPRRLIQAQNRVAEAGGAVIRRERVTGIETSGTTATVTTASGKMSAEKVLVAAGAFTNFNGLLPKQLPLTIETEIVALGRLSPETGRELTATPTVKYFIDDPVLDSLYVVPPVRYPDGNYYVKMGANTTGDQVLDRLVQVQDWFRHGDSEFCRAGFDEAMRAMWPLASILSVETKRCILCRTPTGNPIIDHVGEGVFVATGGNGAGAKGSDAWGELAAGLVHDGRWPGDRAPYVC